MIIQSKSSKNRHLTSTLFSSAEYQYIKLLCVYDGYAVFFYSADGYGLTVNKSCSMLALSVTHLFSPMSLFILKVEALHVASIVLTVVDSLFGGMLGAGGIADGGNIVGGGGLFVSSSS